MSSDIPKLYINNTLKRKKEEFKPLVEGEVSFYHCGPTVYWTQHVGNLRAMSCGDFVVRTLRYLGYDVTHVRNYTDVGHLTSDADEGEDKMEKGAKKEGKTPAEIARKYIEIFEQDTLDLNLVEPDFKPMVTQHIREIISMVKILLTKGYAYSTDLAIYFDVSKFEKYGQLTGQNQTEKLIGAGSGEISDNQKKNPADFVLWFFRAGTHKNVLQFWPSPFKSNLVSDGLGFPGWHIECSAMSKKYLGDTIDIHMGGIEHVPIHHTNEIAQSEAANGVKFVNYWIHNEHLVLGGEKLAKSSGTTLGVGLLKQKGYNPLALRYFFLQAHYKSKQNFTWEALEAAQKGLNHLYNQVRELGSEIGELNLDFQKRFITNLTDDFNTPKALSLVQKLLKSNLAKKDKLATIFDFDRVLGLNLETEIKKINIPKEVKALVDKRDLARQEKDFQKSDQLRDELEKLGYTVEDTQEGTRVFKA